MANAFVVHSLAMPLVSANLYLTAVWMMDWVLSHSRLTPTDDWCLHQGVYMAMGTSWLNPTWLFGLQECWSARPSLWVCACLQTELLCVSFEIPHTGDTTWYLSSSVSISSLCVRIPRSWSFAPNDMISSSFTAEHPSLLCTCHIVFMHSPVNGYYDGLQILATVNSAAMNIALQGSFSIRLCRDTDPTCGFQVLW